MTVKAGALGSRAHDGSTQESRKGERGTLGDDGEMTRH